jgi:hypothetical protein
MIDEDWEPGTIARYRVTWWRVRATARTEPSGTNQTLGTRFGGRLATLNRPS